MGEKPTLSLDLGGRVFCGNCGNCFRGENFLGLKFSAMRLFGSKMAKNGPKRAKNGQKWPKMAKIKGFLTLFRQKHRKSAPEAFFFAFRPSPGLGREAKIGCNLT